MGAYDDLRSGDALAIAGRMFQYGIAMTRHSTRFVLAETRP